MGGWKADLSCSAGHHLSERAASGAWALRGQLLRRDGPTCLREARTSPRVGAVCANAYQFQPCYWAPGAPFLQVNLSFGLHPVTVSAAHWQAPAASALRAWGRRLAGTAGPSPHGYRKVAGDSLAATQILQAQTERSDAFSLSPVSGRSMEVSLVWPHAADAGAPEVRQGERGVFSCEQKAKAQ